jgi:hypothetical protein
MNKGGIFFGGLCFMAGFVAFYFMAISPVIDATKIQFWHSTQGQLVDTAVSSHQKHNDDGSSTTMYGVRMEYSYKVGNTTYYGNRARIRNDESSNNSDNAYALVHKVRQEQARNNSITIWYNPNNERQSVYSRSLNVRLLLAMTLFSSVFMMIGGGIIATSSGKKELPPENSDPSKPWTTRNEWASAIIYSDAQSSLSYAKFFFILSAVMFGMIFTLTVGHTTVSTLLSLLCFIVPTWLFLRAKRIEKEWTFFQKVPLTLNPYPAMIGGKVKGTLAIPVNKSPSDKYLVTLKCTHYWTSSTGSKRESMQSVVYSQEQRPTVRPESGKSVIAFDFDIPAEQEQSSEPSNSYHKWTVTIKGNLTANEAGNTTGINFDRDYEVPVFITEKSMSIDVELDVQPLTRDEKNEMNSRLDIDHSHHRQEMTLTTPGSKNSLPIAGIGLIFLIAGILIGILANGYFGIAFSAMSTIFIGLGLWGWGRNCKIYIKPNSIKVDVFFRSKFIKQHNLTNENINEIEAFSSSVTHTNGKKSNETFCLRLLTNEMKFIDLGGEFKSMKNATHMKNEIEQVLGVYDE